MDRGMTRAGLRRWTWLAGLAALAGCGGGGGGPEVLQIDVRYEARPSLLRSSTVPPVLVGFQGHAPTCTLLTGSPFAGTLPPGMTLAPDCTVSGTPTAAGTFGFGMTVGASGVANTVVVQAAITVVGPPVEYSAMSMGTWAVGRLIDWSPEPTSWIPGAGEVLTYAIAAGALPPGLTLDPATGRIHGYLEGPPGPCAFTVRTTLAAGGREATSDAPASLSVDYLEFRYPRPSLTIWAGDPADVRPVFAVDGGERLFTLEGGTLPAGLRLDPATGAITGIPTEVTRWSALTVWAEVTFPGTAPITARAGFSIEADSPVFVYYPSGAGGTLPLVPTFAPRSTAPVTFAFSPTAACPLRDGVVIDPVTGVISGVQPPAGQGVFLSPSCREVLVEMTLNGVTVPVVAPM